MEKLTQEQQDNVDKINSIINDVLICINEFDNFSDRLKLEEYDVFVKMIKDLL